MGLKLITVLATHCAIGLAGVASAAPPVVPTESGPVRGSISDGVKSWKGIPFAATTAGANRWRPPQPVAKWREARDATQYGHDCMQLPFGGDAAPLGTEPSEDCLVLNVWAPDKAAKGAKLPVIAWIYGGGFVNGGSSPPTYSGENMARKGVVFVSFNYRLGRFGTFLLPQLVGENAGNYGYMDQLAALKWIKRNIAAFGGNPDNVTLIGESAGGASVNTMLTSPMAHRLFQRAVVMSGGNGEVGDDDSRKRAQEASLAFAAAKGVQANDPQALEKLRAFPGEAIVDGLNLAALFNPRPGALPFASPFVDGQLAVDPGKAFASGRFARVPVMIGATGDDIGGPTGYMVGGAHDLAGTISAAGVPVFEYRFSYVASSIGEPGAHHATDIPFFFDTQAIKYGDKTSDRDRGMGRIISAYIVNFARAGDPNGAGLANWPRYSRAADPIMNFADDGAAVPGKDPLSGKFPVIIPAAAVDQNGADMVAAKAWLSLVDSAQWDQSWTAAGAIFKSQMPQAAWASANQKFREPLGAVSSRILKQVTRFSSLPGVPDGEYEFLNFQTSFATKPGATETVLLAHEASGWKVLNYGIQ
ncbi:MAG: carboxylesterase family protein [Sphingomonadales bacterium]|nr:carboxylesterase family protein [Sphingomonadales bacterium]